MSDRRKRDRRRLYMLNAWLPIGLGFVSRWSALPAGASMGMVTCPQNEYLPQGEFSG